MTTIIADFRKDKPVYVVSYEYDPSAQRGYVYLPGRADKWWSLNVGTILRSVEGNWFRAWNLWDDLARPLLAHAKTKP